MASEGRVNDKRGGVEEGREEERSWERDGDRNMSTLFLD